jgi:hypothetical protein
MVQARSGAFYLEARPYAPSYGREENEIEARRLLDKAMLLRRDLDPEDHRGEAELSDEDWDKLVYYFNR